MKRRLGAVLALLAACAMAGADTPARTEQLIWSVIAFNGKDYSATFAPETSRAIYLLAGAPSILSARVTFVYWWPLTSEWKTDTDSLNVALPGTLEVLGGTGRARSIPVQDYTYWNARGEYEQNWQVATGDAARAEIQRYRDLDESYFAATRAYQLANQEYERQVEELGLRVGQLQSRGADASAIIARMRALSRPEPPSPPSRYSTAPSDLQQGFVVDLAPGRYSIRLRGPDGAIMDGSDRTLVVHERRRAGRVGLEVIPGDKWTRPEESVTPSSVLSVNGAADLYLRPFFEDEVNDLAWQKTVDNGARGNANVWRWVRVQQVPRAVIEVRAPGGEVSTLREQPFRVTQTQGAGLGYTIAPWDPRGPEKEPDLVAFRLAVRGKATTLRLRVLDAQGNALPGGEREVRVWSGPARPGLTLALALLPLLAMAVVILLRSRLYARGPAEED